MYNTLYTTKQEHNGFMEKGNVQTYETLHTHLKWKFCMCWRYSDTPIFL